MSYNEVQVVYFFFFDGRSTSSVNEFAWKTCGVKTLAGIKMCVLTNKDLRVKSALTRDLDQSLEMS